MTPEQTAHFRAKLLTSRATLAAELAAIPAFADLDDPREGDQADKSTAETDRDLIAINRARVQTLLNQTDQALTRLDNGTYGICDDTGEPIGLKRLEAQPTATLSLAAQEARERRVA